MSMSADLANRVMEACKARARELRSPVSIAIVDTSGHLVSFERMMSPYGWATANISIAKATSTVMFNQPTDAIAQWASAIPGFAASMAAMTQGKFILAGGGWPIRVNGTTMGGLGISGGNAPGRDDEIAKAGLAAAEMSARAPQPQTFMQPQMQPMPQPQAGGMSPVQPFVQPAQAQPAAPAVEPFSGTVEGWQNIPPISPSPAEMGNAVPSEQQDQGSSTINGSSETPENS